MTKSKLIDMLLKKKKDYEAQMSAAYRVGDFYRYERFEHYIDVIIDIIKDVDSLE